MPERFILEVHDDRREENGVMTLIIGETHEFKEIQIDPEIMEFLISSFKQIDNQTGKQIRLRKSINYGFRDSV